MRKHLFSKLFLKTHLSFIKNVEIFAYFSLFCCIEFLKRCVFSPDHLILPIWSCLLQITKKEYNDEIAKEEADMFGDESIQT